MTPLSVSYAKVLGRARCHFGAFFILVLLAFKWDSPAEAQTWVTNTPMIAARWSHTATLLTNGQVLITGGTIYNVNGNFADTNECELYDPAAGTSTLTAPMQSKRHSHLATLLPNGQVLVTGGGGDVSSEVYDPPSASWINYANMNDERLVHTATLLTNGLVLAAGGYDDNHGQELASAELYYPDSAAWTNVQDMPYAADTLAAALLDDGRVLVCGGYMGTDNTNAAALYDPDTETWTSIAPMKEARSGHTATLLSNGTVLVEGGSGDNTAELYDPVAGKWTYTNPMNDSRYQPNAVLLTNGQVMVLGDGGTHVELYDPSSNTWTYADSLPVAANHQTATLVAGGAVVVTGGSVSEFNGPPIATVQTYGTVLSGAPGLAVTDNPQSGAVPLTVQFTSPGVDADGNTVTNWSWNFGDGGTSSSQSPSHTYTSEGFYTPTLTAFSTYGSTPLSVTGLAAVNVTNHILAVTANPTGGAAPLVVRFSSPAVDSAGYAVTNWNWNFGDGGSSSAQNPEHIYTNAGSFSPTLVAYSTFGTQPLDIAGLGGIFVTIPPNPFFHTIYSFSQATGPGPFYTNSDGTAPNGGLVVVGRTLYGAAGHGGAAGEGDIFAVNTDGTGFTNIHDCTLNNGALPNGGLVANGNTLYGTKYVGGFSGGGTVFSIATDGAGYTNFYTFSLGGPNTGEESLAGLVLSGNTLYGTTFYGGAYTHGTVFSVETNGANINDIHSFTPPDGNNVNPDGIFPESRLILAGGVLYGTTEGGGPSARGTVFAVNPGNPSFQPVHDFSTTDAVTGTNQDGAFPFGGLVVSGNTLFGVTAFGGTYGNGTIFAVNTDSTGFTVLHNFTGGADGGNPHDALTLSGNALFGSAPVGGSPSTNGTLFAINLDGSGFTNLYNFSGGTDGSGPHGDLLLSGGALYGTSGGGDSGSGTVFRFTLPKPRLSLKLSGTNAILTWSTLAAGYGLQSTHKLGAGAVWTPVAPLPALVNGQNSVTAAITATNTFYRLGQ